MSSNPVSHYHTSPVTITHNCLSAGFFSSSTFTKELLILYHTLCAAQYQSDSHIEFMQHAQKTLHKKRMRTWRKKKLDPLHVLTEHNDFSASVVDRAWPEVEQRTSEDKIQKVSTETIRAFSQGQKEKQTKNNQQANEHQESSKRRGKELALGKKHIKPCQEQAQAWQSLHMAFTLLSSFTSSVPLTLNHYKLPRCSYDILSGVLFYL
jgi:hypothetical protein